MVKDNAQYRILLYENDEALNLLIRKTLYKHEIIVDTAISGKEILQKLKTNNYDILLLDYSLPDINCEVLINQVMKKYNDSIFIIMTGYKNIKTIVDIMKVGAFDYLVKDNTFIEILEPVIKIAIKQIVIKRRLKKVEKDFIESDERLRLLTDNMLDLIVQIDKQGKIIYASPSHFLVTGWNTEDMVGKYTYEFQHPDDIKSVSKLFIKSIREKIPGRLDYRVRKVNGDYIWIESVGNTILDDKGNVKGAILSSRDIDERKRAEERLKYMAEHDSLTKLFNREYFEKQMQSLEKSKICPVGILLFDVDGLKLVNDSLGTKAGDALLLATAELLKQTIPTEGVLARVGGDEFAMLIPHYTEDKVKNVRAEVKELINEYNNKNSEHLLSISTGYAIKNSVDTSLQDHFKKADEYMYREKLLHSQSTRSGIVEVVMKALEERDFITEGHTDRIQDTVKHLAKAISLPDYKINDLCLFARFHDIGKVGIADSILFKPERLSTEEMNAMKKHSEIGFRIAQSSPDLAHIADLILKHHEWWNGKGYPLGLKSEEIPLECRILSIADAYDAMSNDRPYRKAMSRGEIISEMLRCAGEQFDAQLVDIFLTEILQYKKPL